MTSPLLQARVWAGAASAAAQISATSAGMLPWWALPLTLVLTALVSRPPGPLDPRRARLTRGVAVAAVAAFAGLIASHSIAAGRAGADPVATLRSLTEALVVLSLVMAPTSRTPREYRVWLTVTTGVLVAAAAGAKNGTAGVISGVSWVVLLAAITRVQTTVALDGGTILAAPRPRGAAAEPHVAVRRTDGLVPVLAALAAGVAVYFALPAGLGGGDLARTIAHHVHGGTNTNLEANRSVVGVDTYGDGDLSLLIRGALADTPLLRVPSTSPALWRGTFYRTYTGTSWEDNPAAPFTPSAGPSTAVPRSADDPVPVGRVETDHVTIPTFGHVSLIWAPGVPVHVRGPSTEIGQVIRGANNVRAFGQHPLTSYTVRSVVATTSPKRLRAAVGSDPSNPQWTQLPAELPSDVGALAHQITARAHNRYDQVSEIEAYLRGHETYELNSPVPGPGQDAVADFLFRDHTGFCEQFASAEAVMLRTLGVPARVVSGLAYGVGEGATRLYTASDAHAWVEVYYPGIGWSPSDPTAGALLASAPNGSPSWLSRAVDAVLGHVPGGRVVLIVIMMGLFGSAVALARVSRRGRGGVTRRRVAHRPAVGPVLAAFHRLASHPRGPAPRAPTETAREYIGRVTEPGRLNTAVATLEQECYGSDPPDVAAAQQAIDAFGGLAESTAGTTDKPRLAVPTWRR